ncbi:MAG TPA: MmcQ/YjbR family DNA-binding protein [Streptosporangiaceae bacterium]|jgi:predicted DNA-binding protein (MmcQ/YjbR family)
MGSSVSRVLMGQSGWIGVRLDRDVDWSEIAELCQDAYRVIAPARLAAQLDDQPSG